MMLKELVKKISFFKDSEYFQSGLLRSIKTETKLLEERTIVNNFLSLLIDSKFDYDFILSILFSELYMNICQHSESEQSFYYFQKIRLKLYFLTQVLEFQIKFEHTIKIKLLKAILSVSNLRYKTMLQLKALFKIMEEV